MDFEKPCKCHFARDLLKLIIFFFRREPAVRGGIERGDPAHNIHAPCGGKEQIGIVNQRCIFKKVMIDWTSRGSTASNFDN